MEGLDLDKALAGPTEEQLKAQLEAARDKAEDEWRNLPDGLDWSEYDARTDEIYKDVRRLSKEYRLIKTPEWTDADDWEKEECLMTFDEFKECCDCGGFIDYDGSGEYGNETQKSGITVLPSDLKAGKFRKDFTHVYWYNK